MSDREIKRFCDAARSSSSKKISSLGHQLHTALNFRALRLNSTPTIKWEALEPTPREISAEAANLVIDLMKGCLRTCNNLEPE